MVKVKLKNPVTAFLRGYQFHNGFCDNVKAEDAEIMVKEFGMEIVEEPKPVKPEAPKQKAKPKKAKAKVKDDE